MLFRANENRNQGYEIYVLFVFNETKLLYYKTAKRQVRSF